MKFDTTQFLAIWGAIIGTLGIVISIILGIRKFCKDKRKLRIQISLTSENPFWIISDGGRFQSSSPRYIVVNLYNNGFRSIQLRNVFLQMFEGEKITECKFIKQALPFDLAENQAIDAYFDIGDIIPAFGSTKDRLHKACAVDMNGKKWEINIPKSIYSQCLENT